MLTSVAAVMKLGLGRTLDVSSRSVVVEMQVIEKAENVLRRLWIMAGAVSGVPDVETNLALITVLFSTS